MPKVTTIPPRKQRNHAVASQETRKIRVAAYCRVSTDTEEQATSYQAQIAHYEEVIHRNPEWVFAGIYADDGISATSTKHREQFHQMIQDCMDGKIDMLITKSISRFARNTMDAKGEVLITIMASLAQQESESLSQNVKLGMQYRFQQGKVMVNASCFLGYDKDENGDLVINPEQAETVKRIYREYLEGASCQQIARGLERDGIRTARGNTRWHDSSIRLILENEKYMGDALLQKTYTVDFLKKKRIKNNGEMPQYYVEDDHEAIIPRALFLQVQEEIARRGSQVDCMGRRRGFSAKHCFTGLLYFAECGEQFRRIHWNNRGCKSVVWRCMTRLEKKGACHARTVYEESLKQAFVDALNQLTGSSETYLSILQENMAEVIEMEPSNLPEEIQRKLDVLQKKLIECAERHEDYEEIAQEIFRLREQKEQALRENVSQQEQKDRMRELQEFLAAQPHHITEFDETLVRHLLAKVTVSSDRLNFTFQSGVTVSIKK